MYRSSLVFDTSVGNAGLQRGVACSGDGFAGGRMADPVVFLDDIVRRWQIRWMGLSQADTLR